MTFLSPHLTPHTSAMPSAVDSERVVIGSIFLNETLFQSTAAELSPNDFYNEGLRELFIEMGLAYAANIPLEVIAVGERLKHRNAEAFERLGGIRGIADIAIGMPVLSDVQDYLQRILAAAKLRELIHACSAISLRALNADPHTVAEVAFFAQTSVNTIALDVINGTHRGQTFEPLSAVIDRDVLPFLKALTPLPDGTFQQKPHTIPTGFVPLDAAIGGGLSTSDIMVINGLTGSGKSSLALQIAYNAAAMGFPAAFLAGEMTNMDNALRIISQQSRYSNLRGIPYLSHEDEAFLEKWATAIRNTPLFFDHRTLDINTLRTRIAALIASHGIRLLVVDYLQLFKVARNDKGTRYEIVTAVSQELKRIANEFDLAVISVAQFNRSAGKTGHASMYDSADSSQIEKDASIYMIVDRKADTNQVELRIEKGRNVGTCIIPARFIGRCVRFEIE